MPKNLLGLIRAGISQAEMSAKYGITQQTWSSWETGRTTPDLEIMLRMECETGIPMEIIFFEEFNHKIKLKNITRKNESKAI